MDKTNQTMIFPVAIKMAHARHPDTHKKQAIPEALQTKDEIVVWVEDVYVQTELQIRSSPAGEDTRLSPERPRFKSRWRKSALLVSSDGPTL